MGWQSMQNTCTQQIPSVVNWSKGHASCYIISTTLFHPEAHRHNHLIYNDFFFLQNHWSLIADEINYPNDLNHLVQQINARNNPTNIFFFWGGGVPLFSIPPWNDHSHFALLPQGIILWAHRNKVRSHHSAKCSARNTHWGRMHVNTNSAKRV